MEEEKSLAMDLIEQQKRTMRFQWILIVILVALLAATNIFHIYQWSRFDTVVVDSGDGGGNAGYIGNDGNNNFGGVEDGESGGTQTEENKR